MKIAITVSMLVIVQIKGLKKKVMKVIRKEDDIRNIFKNRSISVPLPLGDKNMFTADEDEILIRLKVQ